MTATAAAFDIPDDESVVGFVTIRVSDEGNVIGEHHPVTTNRDMLTPTKFTTALRLVADAIELEAVTTIDDIATD